jgi:hypothetical protein
LRIVLRRLFCEFELFSSENGLLWRVNWMNRGMKLNLNGHATFRRESSAFIMSLVLVGAQINENLWRF